MTPAISLTIDCAKPELLIAFWCAALKYQPQPAPPGHDTWRSYYLSIGETEEDLGDGDACDRIVDPRGEGPQIWFQVVPEPKTAKNRMHLDIHRTDPAATWDERRAELSAITVELLRLGGSLRQPLPDSADEHLSCSINDPEGNELCIV